MSFVKNSRVPTVDGLTSLRESGTLLCFTKVLAFPILLDSSCTLTNSFYKGKTIGTGTLKGTISTAGGGHYGKLMSSNVSESGAHNYTFGDGCEHATIDVIVAKSCLEDGCPTKDADTLTPTNDSLNKKDICRPLISDVSGSIL